MGLNCYDFFILEVDGGSGGENAGGGGGGGRIAVYRQHDEWWSGRLQAYGGPGSPSTGAAGSVYVQVSSSSNQLRCFYYYIHNSTKKSVNWMPATIKWALFQFNHLC